MRQRYGSRSGSFYHQAKIERKTLIPAALGLLFDFLSLKNDVNVLQKVGNVQKNILKKKFFVNILKANDEIAGSGSASGSICQRHGSANPDPDPDPHQNVMDPQHCYCADKPCILS